MCVPAPSRMVRKFARYSLRRRFKSAPLLRRAVRNNNAARVKLRARELIAPGKGARLA
jgi:hypothetical protein